MRENDQFACAVFAQNSHLAHILAFRSPIKISFPQRPPGIMCLKYMDYGYGSRLGAANDQSISACGK